MLASITRSSTIDYMPFEHARPPEEVTGIVAGAPVEHRLGVVRGRYFYYRIRHLMNRLTTGSFDGVDSNYCGIFVKGEDDERAQIWQTDGYDELLSHTEVVVFGDSMLGEGINARIFGTTGDIVGSINLGVNHAFASDKVVGHEVVDAVSALAKLQRQEN